MRFALAAFVCVHGLIHLLGFAKAFGWARNVPLQGISKLGGTLWLTAAMLLVATSVLVAADQRRAWSILALAAVVLSQSLVVAAWGDAKFGTIPNAVILLSAFLTMVDLHGSGYRQAYRMEVERRLTLSPPAVELTASDALHLPTIVRRYLEYVGAVGRNRVTNFRATMRGEIRRHAKASFMPFEAEQHNFVGEPARLFLMRASLFGLPFDAFHRYTDGSATMRVKVASLITVVDAHGAEMNRSETVTLFNDMCILAPPTLVDPAIRWEELDPLTVKAWFTNAGNTISAVLSFNEKGELTNFQSDDRYLSADGKTYEKYRWSTPVRDYRDFGGRRAATRGEASWKMPNGEFVYIRLEILNIEYNVGRN